MLEALGIEPASSTGESPTERDSRRIWQLFAEHYFLFRGTPTAAWLDYQLQDIFGIAQALDGRSALRIYDEIAEKLSAPEFRPRALFDRFNIEYLATTEGPHEDLVHHATIRASGWPGRVVTEVAAIVWARAVVVTEVALMAIEDGTLSLYGLIEKIVLRGMMASKHGAEWKR